MSKKRTDLKIPYGIMDFRRLRREGYYYVDKTEYLAQMEARDSFIFFVRPRRFGKSLFISMMESYYDLNRKKDFKMLFGDLWIGKHPTENANRFMTLKLDFSKVGGTGAAAAQAVKEGIDVRAVDARKFNQIGVNGCGKDKGQKTKDSLRVHGRGTGDQRRADAGVRGGCAPGRQVVALQEKRHDLQLRPGHRHDAAAQVGNGRLSLRRRRQMV